MKPIQLSLPKIWYNIRGEELQIKNMGSDHIKNCIFHLASVGTRTRHPEAFRYELRNRGDVVYNTYGENLAVM